MKHTPSSIALIHVPTIGLRFNVFGDGKIRLQPTQVITFVTTTSREAPFIYGDGEATRDFVYVGNIGSALLPGQGTAGEVYNVGTETQTSINSLLASINNGYADCHHTRLHVKAISWPQRSLH